jgi:hypothetical protein
MDSTIAANRPTRRIFIGTPKKNSVSSDSKRSDYCNDCQESMPAALTGISYQLSALAASLCDAGGIG